MTPAAILAPVYAALNTWAKSLGGRATVARDPLDVLIILTQGPAGFLVVLHWAGDQSVDVGADRDDPDDVGVDEILLTPPARSRVEIVVGQNLGLDVRRDYALIAAAENRVPLLERISVVRGRVLAMRFKDDDESLRRFTYSGCDPVTLPDGFPLAAYRLAFEFVSSVDVNATTEDLA
jgi:hypothetical protein